MLQKSGGDFLKQIILNEFIFNFAKGYWELKRQHKIILSTGNWEELIFKLEGCLLYLNIG